MELSERPHAIPVPGDMSAAFRSLAEAFEVIRREGEGGMAGMWLGGEDAAPGDEDGVGDAGLLGQMIRILLREADAPPREVEGVSEEFCDGMVTTCPSSSPASSRR